MDFLELNRGSLTPIAEQIANQLLTAIMDRTLPPGKKLPPERDLADQLGVSRGTVKRAYARLVETEAIDMRRGSGSYVLKNSHILEENQKKEATEIISSTFSRLRGIGLSDKEILNLVNLQYLSSSSQSKIKKISVMVVSNNHDILSELEQQFSYLSDSSPFMFTLSFLTISTIYGSPDPIQLLLGYDLIIATSIDYPDILRVAPMFKNKTIEAAISPSTRTLVQLSSLPSSSQICLVYRTQIFRELVVDTLLSLGFPKGQITTVQEKDYNPHHHSENGATVLLNFNESPVYTDLSFRDRNRDFLAEGGQILRFDYQIQRNSLLHIEDRLQRLLGELQES